MADGPGTLLDQAMPAWDVAEHHQRRVAADLDAVWAALLATPMSDLPVTRALMRVRTFGRGSPGPRARAVVEALPDGWVRIATDFRLVDAGAGTTTLSTDTRVQATGQRARRVFRAYWIAVGWGSGLVRRELLRAVARRAEAGRG